MYAIIENGQVKQRTKKPNWKLDDGTFVSDDVLKAQGYYPIIEDTDLSKNEKKFHIFKTPIQNLVIDEVNKVIMNGLTYLPKTLDEVFTEKCKEVDSTRDGKIYTDVEYTFPDNSTGVIQIRSETDLRNIQVNGMEAMKDVMEGNSDKVHHFMTKENVLKSMSAHEMVNMTSFMKNIGQSVYEWAWQIKHVGLKGIYEDVSKSEEERIDLILNYNMEV